MFGETETDIDDTERIKKLERLLLLDMLLRYIYNVIIILIH